MDHRCIPVELRRALRSEVGFVCPVDGCNNPFLTYHHFDPPYAAGGAHRIEGMIALCLTHHALADAKGSRLGAYSPQRLREMKQSERSVSRGRLPSIPGRFAVLAGGTQTVGSYISLFVGRLPVARLSSALDALVIDAALIDEHGRLAARIEQNDILLKPRLLKDAEFHPKTACWTIGTRGFEKLEVKLQCLSVADATKLFTQHWEDDPFTFSQAERLMTFASVRRRMSGTGAVSALRASAAIRAEALSQSIGEGDDRVPLLLCSYSGYAWDDHGQRFAVRITPWSAHVTFPTGVKSLSLKCMGYAGALKKPKHGGYISLYELNQSFAAFPTACVGSPVALVHVDGETPESFWREVDSTLAAMLDEPEVRNRAAVATSSYGTDGKICVKLEPYFSSDEIPEGVAIDVLRWGGKGRVSFCRTGGETRLGVSNEP